MLITFLTSILYFILLNRTHYQFYKNAPVYRLQLQSQISWAAYQPVENISQTEERRKISLKDQSTILCQTKIDQNIPQLNSKRPSPEKSAFVALFWATMKTSLHLTI